MSPNLEATIKRRIIDALLNGAVSGLRSAYPSHLIRAGARTGNYIEVDWSHIHSTKRRYRITIKDITEETGDAKD